MHRRMFLPLILMIAIALVPADLAAEKPTKESTSTNGKAVLWLDPGDIPSHNLYYGPGGKEDMPKLPVKFLEEDPLGASPKFDVRDQAEKKWKVKLGEEAQPETVAIRLLWAVGYITNENYLFPQLKVEDLPPHLSRGQNFVAKGGTSVKFAFKGIRARERKSVPGVGKKILSKKRGSSMAFG